METIQLLLNIIGYFLLAYLVVDYGRPEIYQLKIGDIEYWIAMVLLILGVFLVNDTVLVYITKWFGL